MSISQYVLREAMDISDDISGVLLDILRRGVDEYYPEDIDTALFTVAMGLEKVLRGQGYDIRVYHYKLDEKYQGVEARIKLSIDDREITVILSRLEAKWGQLLGEDEDLEALNEWLEYVKDTYHKLMNHLK